MAGKRVQGITIEIGGETTKLQTALKQVDSTLSKTQSSLKDVNRLLKLDPTNTELLSQKHKLLQQSITETKERLKTLKEADEQAKQQLEKGELGQDKYDALQREIIETEERLKSLEDEAQKVPSAIGAKMEEAGKKISDVGDKISNVGGKISDVGEGITKNVTAPITAMGAASLAAFNEVDAGMDIIEQKTGASGKALEEMCKSAENLATSIPTDFETAGAAIGEVNTRFGVTGKELEDLSAKFIKFADLNGTDVSSSIDNTQKVMAAFGIETKDAGAVLDTMNAVGQKTGISMDSLAKSMVTNAASLTEMGMSASDAAEFLGQCEMSGTDTTAVMAGLKKALANAAAEGKTLPEALSGFQNTMNSSASETDKLNAAIDLFGAKAESSIISGL